jgi:hypothetical protein
LIIIKEAKDYLQKYLEKNLVLIEKEATHHWDKEILPN